MISKKITIDNITSFLLNGYGKLKYFLSICHPFLSLGNIKEKGLPPFYRRKAIS